jgi:LPS export ABC transporter protein LptC
MADRIQRFFLWLLAIGLVGGTIAALRYATGYRHVAGLGAPPPSLPPNVYLRLSGITVTGRKDGQVAYIVTADRIDSTRNRDRVEFVGNIRAELRQDGQPRATFTAEKAVYSEPTKMLTAEGKSGGQITAVVRGATPVPGRELAFETPRLTWNIGSRQVFCPDAVRLAVKDLTLEGIQLSVDLNTREFTLNRWKGTFSVDEESASSEGLETLKEVVR